MSLTMSVPPRDTAVPEVNKAELEKIRHFEIEYMSRATNTIKAAFLMFREATWHTHILNIKYNKDTVIVDDPKKIGRQQGWFAPFPDHLTPTTKDKAAVLSNMACHDIGYMRKLIEQVLQGMNLHIQELMFRLVQPTRRTIVQYADNSVDLNDYNHWFLHATSHITGEQWAIDIAGDQFAIGVPGIPWIYARHAFVKEILAFFPLGTLEKYSVAVAQTKSLEGLEADVQMQAMAAFHATVDPAMERKGLSWEAILRKSEKDYVRHRDKVLRVGREAIERFRAAQNLTRRRVKAERFEKRHFKEMLEESTRISEGIFGKEFERVGRKSSGTEKKEEDVRQIEENGTKDE